MCGADLVAVASTKNANSQCMLRVLRNEVAVSSERSRNLSSHLFGDEVISFASGGPDDVLNRFRYICPTEAGA
jgi:hypothetical protein